MKDDHQQRMSHGHQGFLASQALEQAEELTAQVAVFLQAGSPGRLHQSRTQISVAFAGTARQALAARGFVAGTDTGPTRQVRVAREVRFHLYANLCDDDFSCSWPKSGDRTQVVPGSGQLRAVSQIVVDLFADAPIRRLQLFP